ncbi:MAG: DUF4192 family protein [Actinobacteria bacterium]|nr:DUF4192 family protein [Actinomycetota bacterium]
MTTIVHAAGAAELLAAIPVLTGFAPRDSLVLLPFRGSRTAGALRFDLPHPAPDGPSAEEFAATAIGLACRVPETDALALAVYTDEGDSSAGAPSALPRALLVAELVRRAEACGLHIVEALHVGSESWADYRDPSASPRPLDEVPDAPAIPGFAGPAPDQFSGTELPDPGLFAGESVGRALIALERLLGSAAPGRKAPARKDPIDPRASEMADMLDDLPAFLETVLDAPESLPPFATAALIWILDRPALRDVALVQWASTIDHGDRALSAQLLHRRTRSAVPADVGGLLIGQGPRPDRDRLGVALTLVRCTAGLAPRDARGGPLAAAAWLSWAVGRSTHAAQYLDRAQEVDPKLSFAQLLRAVIDAGMLPDWSFSDAAA